MSYSSIEKALSNTCKIPSLGRSFHLGMLYNLPKDEVIAGVTLWGGDTLQSNSIRSPNFSCMYDVKSIDTTEERFKSLSIDGDASLSVICNLVKAEGAATFLQNRKASENVASVTMKYHVQTYFDQLPMEKLGNPEYLDSLKQVEATHVVTGIQYGADAFFVFEKGIEKTENRMEVEGRMKLHINQMFPIIPSDLKGDLKPSIDQLKTEEKFNCMYFGDIIPDRNPSSEVEAIMLYQNLKAHLGENYEKAVPKVIHLAPLNVISSLASTRYIPSICRRVSDKLVRHTHDLLDLFEALQDRIINAQKEVHCLPYQFGNFSGDIECFKNAVSNIKANFLANLAAILPRIRKEKENESKLVEILSALKSGSPTCLDSLNAWLKFKRNEMEFLKQFLDMIPATESNNIQHAFGPGVMFNRLVSNPRSNSPIISLHLYLTSREDQMLQIFKKASSSDQFSVSTMQCDDPAINNWMKDDTICQNLRENVIQFAHLVSANEGEDIRFIVTDNTGSGVVVPKQGCKLMLREFGKNGIDTKELEKLEKFEKLFASEVDDSSITLKWFAGSHQSSLPLKGCKLYYRKVAVEDDWTTTVTSTSTTCSMRVPRLLHNTSYEFKIAPNFGGFIGIESPICGPVATKRKIIRRRSTLCLPKEPEASVIAGNDLYRNGYPGKRDDHSINHNYEFFSNKRPSCPKGDLVDNIHDKWWGNYQVLESHDFYTQWLFPTRSGPGVNKEAKELQPHEIKVTQIIHVQKIIRDPKAIERLIKSYRMMLDFFGLELVDNETGEVCRSDNWKERFDNLNKSEKNHLRITRILKCLGELGLEHLKAPLVKHLLKEIIIEGTLERCLKSCMHYWIEVLKNDEQRIELQKYAKELF